MDEITVIPASHEDWAGLVRRAAEPDGHEARVVLEIHQRLLAVEARLPWVGTAADVAPQVVPTTTANGLSPVEPAPQAPQVVTVEELIQSLPPNFRDAQAYEWAAARAGYLQHDHASPATRAALAAEPAEGLSPKEIEAQEAFTQMRDDVLSGVEGLDNDQINSILHIIDNYTPEWV